jgi:hypothetical protein
MNEFVMVSAMGTALMHSSVSADALKCRYAGTEDHEGIVEFIEKSRPGSYIELNESHLLFRVLKKE